VVYPTWIPENIDNTLYNLLDLCLSDRKTVSTCRKSAKFYICQNPKMSKFSDRPLQFQTAHIHDDVKRTTSTLTVDVHVLVLVRMISRPVFDVRIVQVTKTSNITTFNVRVERTSRHVISCILDSNEVVTRRQWCITELITFVNLSTDELNSGWSTDVDS